MVGACTLALYPPMHTTCVPHTPHTHTIAVVGACEGVGGAHPHVDLLEDTVRVRVRVRIVFRVRVTVAVRVRVRVRVRGYIQTRVHLTRARIRVRKGAWGDTLSHHDSKAAPQLWKKHEPYPNPNVSTILFLAKFESCIAPEP